MRRVLLDTNAYSSLLAGDEDVLDTIADADRVFMSIFVLGELLAGFLGGNRRQENEARLDAFLRKPTVRILNATHETAHHFSSTKHDLRLRGTPIPINDVWIAAHALETGSLVVTYDRHFQQVPGLRLWNKL